MKLTKKQIMEFDRALGMVASLGGAKFAYAVARNINKIALEVDLLSKMVLPKEDFLKYDEERAEVAASFAEKNKDGTAKVENGQYVVPDPDLLAKALESVKEKHKPAMDARAAQLKEFEETLKEEMDIDIYKINEIFLPETITGNQVSGILIMIEEKSVN